MDRRSILKGCGAMLMGAPFVLGDLCGCSKGSADLIGRDPPREVDGMTSATYFADAKKITELPRREGRYYKKLPNGSVKCELCPWLCELKEGERARCLIRENKGGRMDLLAYGLLCKTVRAPPHFLPINWGLVNRPVLWLGHAGCNFECSFCVSHEYAFAKPEDIPSAIASPKEIVDIAVKDNCRALGFRLTEVTINLEFVIDVYKEAQARGILTVVATNGFIMKEPLEELLKHTDAIQVGLKSMDEEFYKTYMNAQLGPVLETIQRLPGKVPYLSVGYVLIPTLNGSDAQLKRTFEWVFEKLGPDTHLQLFRFIPLYNLVRIPAGNKAQLLAAVDYCRSIGFRYVVATDFLEKTNTSSIPCYQCGKTLIERLEDGTVRHIVDIPNMKCSNCGAPHHLIV